MISWYYYIARWCVILYFRIFTRWKVEGLENVPDKGAVMVVSNHLSNNDPPLVSVTLQRTAIFMAKEELFRNQFVGYFMHGFGAFPVHRGKLDRQALRYAEKVLAANKILVMFPEAKRSKEKARLDTAYPGSALIALRNDVPVIPVGITGTEKLTGWRWMYRRYTLTIRFGKPFSLSSRDKKRNREGLEESTNLIMEHIAELLPEEYRGVYADQEEQIGYPG